MAGITDVINWLRGSQPTPSLGMEKAPPLANYPTDSDADYARNYGFADNSINEDYLNNNKARILGLPVKMKALSKGGEAREVFLPFSGNGKTGKEVLSDDMSADVNLNNDRELQGNLRNVMMSAALAANRSPVAAMGFDPSRTVMDVAIENPSVAGLYRPDVDRAYATMSDPSAIVHESTHRGLQKLREKYPDQVNPLMATLPPEEYVVRWLMHSKGGDPEGKLGSIDAEQRQKGMDFFEGKLWPSSAAHHGETLQKIEELAIQDRLTRSPRSGPQ